MRRRGVRHTQYYSRSLNAKACISANSAFRILPIPDSRSYDIMPYGSVAALGRRTAKRPPNSPANLERRRRCTYIHGRSPRGESARAQRFCACLYWKRTIHFKVQLMGPGLICVSWRFLLLMRASWAVFFSNRLPLRDIAAHSHTCFASRQHGFDPAVAPVVVLLVCVLLLGLYADTDAVGWTNKVLAGIGQGIGRLDGHLDRHLDEHLDGH